MERQMYKLSPSIGPVKWRYGVEARFQFNAQRCRKIALGLTDRKSEPIRSTLLSCGSS